MLSPLLFYTWCTVYPGEISGRYEGMKKKISPKPNRWTTNLVQLCRTRQRWNVLWFNNIIDSGLSTEFLSFIHPTHPVVSGFPSPSSAAGSAAGWPSSRAPSAPLCSFLSSPQAPPLWTSPHFLLFQPGPRTSDPPLNRDPRALKKMSDYIALDYIRLHFIKCPLQRQRINQKVINIY